MNLNSAWLEKYPISDFREHISKYWTVFPCCLYIVACDGLMKNGWICSLSSFVWDGLGQHYPVFTPNNEG